MDLIKIALGDYPRYEELLLRKDKFEKEALHWYSEYIRVFGKYLIDVFEIKVECIRLKKLISLAQAQINQGFTPDMDKINELVNEQMLSYYEDLKNMVKEHEDAKKAKELPSHEILRIKKIYREIAKILHLSQSAVKNRLLRARRALRQRLAGDTEEPSTRRCLS